MGYLHFLQLCFQTFLVADEAKSFKVLLNLSIFSACTLTNKVVRDEIRQTHHIPVPRIIQCRNDESQGFNGVITLR